VNLKELNPQLSYREIGNKIGRSQSFAMKWVKLSQLKNSVANQPRSGRPRKLNSVAIQHVLAAAKQKQCKSAAAIATKVQQKAGIKVSISTVERALKSQGLKHLRPKVVPMLTATQKATRVMFAKKCMRGELVCWRNVLITDSSIFRMHPMGKPAGSWCTQATRGTVGRPKHSPGVHCYMGMSYGGVTKLKFVTATPGIQKFTNPKTKREYSGVGSEEYKHVLQQHLIPEGKRLFQQAGRRSEKWQLQQDNAPAHKTKENMEIISKSVPGGHFLSWPPNSPDLSPIENLWAWMEQQLGDREGINTTDDLQARLTEIRDSISITHVRALFDGMHTRMQRVVKLQGNHIGK